MKQYYVYLLANKNKTVIYVGVTSDLVRRVHQHKTKRYQKSFTAKYNCDRLVYYEVYTRALVAIQREKQIKAGNRERKEKLINKQNPNWNDLSDGWLFDIS
jgi:putative endonuclease